MPRHLVIAVVVVLAAACTPQRGAEAPQPAHDDSRISHPQHARIACEACHRGTARPGGDQHRPCDDGACHRADFLGAPTRLCEVCHVQVTPAPLAAPLKPYPVEDAWQSEPSRFSHRRHLDAAAMEDRVGFHVTCTDCHARRDSGLARPDHAACARCHAPEVALAGAPRMADCAACHEHGSRLRVRHRLIQDDLHFDHTRHTTDRRGGTIRCEECHTQTVRADEYGDHVPPRVESCVGCHDDSDRTPGVMRMRICETCHRRRTETLTSIAPRNHLPLTERPLDHTLAFRRDHAPAAEHNAARCATCHTQMSGNPQQACDECHQTMLPADHRITWRELDHGVEAAADRERCARCHVAEFCTSCHRQRPLSHGMAGSFLTEHAHLARIDIRPCIACHSESFCAPCHTGQSPRRP
ncbi:MAG TPA: cytochrome c3 family protein [Kofleriaceae bacterium]|nr:cytochrome c3 family protein [Kofleriaceae bacterium]